jgi:hypothetical protein
MNSNGRNIWRKNFVFNVCTRELKKLFCKMTNNVLMFEEQVYHLVMIN